MRPPPTGSAVYGRSSSHPEQLGEFLAGGGVGFLQNVVHMGLHSAQGQLQRNGDVLVVLALRYGSDFFYGMMVIYMNVVLI